MRETLRLHPTSGIGGREAATDVIVGDYVISGARLCSGRERIALSEQNAVALLRDSGS